MSYSNHTQNLELPQWLGSDKPNWDIDLNEAFRKIDAKAGSVDESLSSLSGDIGETESAISSLQSEVTSVHDEVNLHGTRISTLESTDASHSQSIAKLNTDVAAMDTTIETLEGSVTQDIEELQSQVTLNTNNINTNSTNITKLKLRFAGLGNNLDTSIGKYRIVFGAESNKRNFTLPRLQFITPTLGIPPLVDLPTTLCFNATNSNQNGVLMLSTSSADLSITSGLSTFIKSLYSTNVSYDSDDIPYTFLSYNGGQIISGNIKLHYDNKTRQSSSYDGVAVYSVSGRVWFTITTGSLNPTLIALDLLTPYINYTAN